jgi:hypothetical protein
VGERGRSYKEPTILFCVWWGGCRHQWWGGYALLREKPKWTSWSVWYEVEVEDFEAGVSRTFDVGSWELCCELSIEIESTLCRTRKKEKTSQNPEGFGALSMFSPWRYVLWVLYNMVFVYWMGTIFIVLDQQLRCCRIVLVDSLLNSRIFDNR